MPDRLCKDSPDGVTTINADGSTGHKIGSSGGQKNGGAGAFVGITKTAGWCPCNDFLIQGHRFHGRRHVGFKPPRGYCVHLNVERRKLYAIDLVSCTKAPFEAL
jgi:hypothetical protein